jgi:hypothetical protein
MPHRTRISRTGVHTIILAAAFAGALACAKPLKLDVAPTVFDSATVVVRYYPWSPTVSVVAWDPDETGYGLRATLRMDGSLIRDHQIYVSTFYLVNYRAYFRADWAAFSGDSARPLLFAGLRRDVHYCDGDDVCSPYETLNARIPDAFLKAARDSLVVRVSGRFGHEEFITVPRHVIDAYLERVASVSMALRKSY